MLKNEFFDNSYKMPDLRSSRFLPVIWQETSPLALLNNFPYSKASLHELTHALDILADQTLILMENVDSLSDKEFSCFIMLNMFGILLTEIKRTRIDNMCPDDQDVLDFTPSAAIKKLQSVPSSGEPPIIQ